MNIKNLALDSKSSEPTAQGIGYINNKLESRNQSMDCEPDLNRVMQVNKNRFQRPVVRNGIKMKPRMY